MSLFLNRRIFFKQSRHNLDAEQKVVHFILVMGRKAQGSKYMSKITLKSPLGPMVFHLNEEEKHVISSKMVIKTVRQMIFNLHVAKQSLIRSYQPIDMSCAAPTSIIPAISELDSKAKIEDAEVPGMAITLDNDCEFSPFEDGYSILDNVESNVSFLNFYEENAVLFDDF